MTPLSNQKPNFSPDCYSKVLGCLLGGAVGDAYGLPMEGISPRRVKKLFSAQGVYTFIPIIHGGMVSDDTEHAVMTVQAFIKSAGDEQKFRQSLKRRLILWLMALPAGVGMATGRSIFKMMLGLSNTGVYSAGNGVAMRASVLGVLCDNLEQLQKLIKISSRLTHTDPKAEQGALLIALLAWLECRHGDWDNTQCLAFIEPFIEVELWHLIENYQPSPKHGITGYIYDTVPAVVQAWQKYRNQPLDGLNYLIAQGGDTDTVGAIFGGIVGVRHGEALFSQMQGVWCEPVLTEKWLKKLATQANMVYQTSTPQTPLRFGGVRTLVRNMGFLGIVLLHGFRRLLPPY